MCLWQRARYAAAFGFLGCNKVFRSYSLEDAGMLPACALM